MFDTDVTPLIGTRATLWPNHCIHSKSACHRDTAGFRWLWHHLVKLGL